MPDQFTTQRRNFARQQAFPVPLLESDPGMSLRQYFAARAPHEIPEWFEPTPPREMPLAPPTDWAYGHPGVARGDARHAFIQKAADDWRRDPVFDVETLDGWTESERHILANYVARWNAYWREHAAWEAEVAQARVAQWPWADLVLAGADLVLAAAEPRS